jgi:GNAT superfamily N-acetyltransferase
MSLEIAALEGKHLGDAAALVSARYRALRERVPFLPDCYGDIGTILPLLHGLAEQAPGVAAIRGGRLAGCLLGCVIPVFRGKRSIFSPEWANAADLDSRRIYQEMYAHLSARWVANGCFTHLISLLAHDRDGIDGWQWLGFGLIAADAVRDLKPVQGPIADVHIRRGRPEDVEQAMVLSEAMWRHLAAAPTFLAYIEKRDRGFHEQWLANSVNALWLAYHGTEAVACMGLGPANPDACTIIRDEKTTSIVRAFTKESVRGRGIATALLNRSLDWARSEGYERCAVDFEPMNILSGRFWMRHFQPICYTLVRHVDERVAWAHEKREDKDLY